MNTRCDIIQDLLPLYCDGVCSEESRKAVEEHLQNCENCKKELDIMNTNIVTVPVHTNDKKIAKAASVALKNSKKKSFIKGCLIALLCIGIFVGGYIAFHYFFSAKGDNIHALARQAATYFGTDEMSIEKTAQRGNYLAALCTDNNGTWYMCAYDRDKLFENRWIANGGTFGFGSAESTKIGSWNYGYLGDAVLIFCGADLPDDICWYTFQNSGITYTCPVENNIVLDIFIIPDGGDDINGAPTALDKNQQPLTEYILN